MSIFPQKNCFFRSNIPLPSLSFRPINYSQVIISSLSQTSLILGSTLFSSILSTLAFVLNPLPLPARATLATAISIQAPDRSTSQQRNLPSHPPSSFRFIISFHVSVCFMSYEVWLFAPTYACISAKLSLYLVNKALSLHNILVFSFHAYRTRQMSVNGGTKNSFFCSG